MNRQARCIPYILSRLLSYDHSEMFEEAVDDSDVVYRP